MENSEIDKIVDLILEGKTYRAIALELKMPLSSLYSGIQSNAEHSARVREALQFSANTFADKAEDVLYEADSTKEEIMRARELAQHYRWKASKRAPKIYGDKLDVTQTVKNENIDLATLSEEELAKLIELQEKIGKTDQA